MPSVYSVSQVNAYIKNMFGQDFLLARIRVRGEVSNCKYHTSGHIYFTLKDENGALSAVMFAGQRRGLSFKMEDGMQVVVSGCVDAYERDGRYQLYAKKIEEDGQGDLSRRFKLLYEKLEAMGMFAAEYKRPIPGYAFRVGVVTAPTGAALQDIINITRRRNPYVQLLLSPAIVQGDEAPDSICRAMSRLEKAGVDVMIVGRGGGSAEDLWCFNDERVARAVFESGVPVISAVGHETDFTICDYAADMRAPTPSAAAELAVFDANIFYEELSAKKAAIRRGMFFCCEQKKSRLLRCRMLLASQHPGAKIQTLKNVLTEKRRRIDAAMQKKTAAAATRFAVIQEKLRAASPAARLAGGYGYIAGPDGKRIDGAAGIHPGDDIKIYMHDGVIYARATGTGEKNYGKTNGCLRRDRMDSGKAL